MTTDAERELAGRVLEALLREDYGGLAGRVTRSADGVELVLPAGRRVRLRPGGLFQDFTVATGAAPPLDEVLATVAGLAGPSGADRAAAFAEECLAAVRARDLHDAHRDEVLARLRAQGPDTSIARETLAAFLDHPVHPTSRARPGLTGEQLTAYAPEFAPSFTLCWVRVPRDRVAAHGEEPHWWPGPGLFPVHPLASAEALRVPGVEDAGDVPPVTVRPTLSMRTVEVDPRTHLKLPLPTSTLGARNRRSIKPGTLADGARAETLLREVLAREPGLPVLVADEQTYADGGHEYLGWMVRRLPDGDIVPVASLLAPSPRDRPRVLDEVAARYRGGDVRRLLADYLKVLLEWNVTLFVRYGVALEAHQQNLALVFGPDGSVRLLVKDNDGLLCSPGLLTGAGLPVPPFADRRMTCDDPHRLADVFVTITLRLAAAAVAFGAGHGDLVAEALAAALAAHGDHPMARLLRARTLDAARLTGKAMVGAGTLLDRSLVAADVNKHYGATGPNYLRHHLNGEAAR
ncbi:IucA/IucC family protein [Sphaerisporangium rubeum]|uniref:Siderophore synthetase component n=1 Tax=Sphaerisporangium rubeum TaxID=321317 RepID=A0A7X0M8R5_9ACTN|nr:siderophore synthetase component [Sphaerisporangium rubeum]